MAMAMFVTALLLLLSCLGTCRGQNVSTYRFLSRPDIVAAPMLNVSFLDPATVSDGYIFVTPNSPARHRNFTVAMHMYNNHGGLVWSGHEFELAKTHQITDFRACNYKDAPHLCVIMYQAPHGKAANNSYSLILDNTYKPVQVVAPSAEYNGSRLTVDLHEFNVIGNGSSALFTSYVTVPYLTTFPQCSSPNVTYLQVGLFTETATDGSNATIFQWNSLDHVDIYDTYLCPLDPKAGSGRFPTDGLDYFHINSVDKNQDGDYLVSGRFVSTIFKIAGASSPSGMKPGSIIWRLGGKRNEFKMLSNVIGSKTFNFSNQHQARWRRGGISLFNNANNEAGQASGNSSSALDVDLDEDNKTATLVYQAIPPSGDLDKSQGSHQILSNGNHFVGMGSTPEVYERTASGALAMDAYVGVTPMTSYRAYKYPWVGLPAATELALFAYAHNCSARTTYYASWNGATTVAKYRILGSNVSTGSFEQVAEAKTATEFETSSSGTSFIAYAYAEALSENGTLLGRSPTVKTFVPATDLAESCNSGECSGITDYSRARQRTCSIGFKYVGG